MRTLWLLRHAKSSWADAEQSDHERPLNARGRDAAERVARHLTSRSVRFDRVFCSSAQRTRETAAALSNALDGWPGTEFDDSLYLAGPEALLAPVLELPEATRSVLVIAHNPGIAQLAATLACDGDPLLRERLMQKFPTGALAELAFEGPWNRVSEGGRLVGLALPRELPAIGESPPLH